MSRWTELEHMPTLLAAAADWRERCFFESRSVFTDQLLWTPDNLGVLYERLLDARYHESGNFLEKLKRQLNGAAPSVCMLASEMLWFTLLPVHKAMRPETK